MEALARVEEVDAGRTDLRVLLLVEASLLAAFVHLRPLRRTLDQHALMETRSR
jgi:hypothetical protein